MAEAVTIARPYAEAVFKLASTKGGLEPWSRMLELAAAVAADPQMRAVIADPAQTPESVRKLFFSVCGDRLDEHGRNLLTVLIDNGRAELLPEIRTMFEGLKAGAEGVIEAQVSSAFPLDDAQLKAIVSQLEQKYHRRIKASVVVVPELIGGVKIEVGDQVLDASVRGRLEAMNAALTH